MVNKAKIKGTRWESDFVELLEKHIQGATAKRVAGSGAIGTSLNEPLLTGDIVARFKAFPRPFRIEAKVGYGGDTQITLQKAWLDKIRTEAEQTYSIPMLACKFLGARKQSGVQYFVAFDFTTFCELMNYVDDLKHELDLVYERLAKQDGDH
jgi:Holliday junction resolvase